MNTFKKICDQCGKPTSDLMQTAYGEFICEDCWDDYICTDRGRVEYLIGIVRGDYPVIEFDADFLGSVSSCWQKFRYSLKLSPTALYQIESTAKAMGLISNSMFLSLNN